MKLVSRKFKKFLHLTQDHKQQKQTNKIYNRKEILRVDYNLKEGS